MHFQSFAVLMIFIMSQASMAHAELDWFSENGDAIKKPSSASSAVASNDLSDCENYLTFQIKSLWDLEMYLRMNGVPDPSDD